MYSHMTSLDVTHGGSSRTVGSQDPWFRMATRCAVRIRTRFGVPDRNTEDCIVRVFRSALRPRRRAGRRPDAATEQAAIIFLAEIRSRSKGKDFYRRLWQRIYREVFSELPSWDNLTRQYRTSVLRRNV